jgi:N-acetylmuramoyl-L-alanine amidase
MKKTLIFVNAGHGGMDDKGNTLTNPIDGKKTLHTNGKFYHNGSWFYEGSSNRDFAMEFIAAASLAGFICMPIFDAQLDTNRLDRIAFANNLAKGKKSIYLSFHSNAAGNSINPQALAEGVCCFVGSLSGTGGKLAAEIMPDVQAVFDKWGSKRRAQLVHDRPLDETARTFMPAILFELGFFDNANNADLLINPAFRAEVITAIVAKLNKLCL